MKQIRQSQENIKQRAMLNELQARKSKQHFGKIPEQPQRSAAQYNLADPPALKNIQTYLHVNPNMKTHSDLMTRDESTGAKEKKIQINQSKLNLIKANIDYQKQVAKNTG